MLNVLLSFKNTKMELLSLYNVNRRNGLPNCLFDIELIEYERKVTENLLTDSSIIYLEC